MYIILFALGIMFLFQGVKAVMKEKEDKKILEEEKRERESWEKEKIEETHE